MLPFKIAWRFIFKSPIQNLLTIFTIIIGVGIQFFILTMSGTLSTIILDNVTLYNEHILVSNQTSTQPNRMQYNPALIEQILDENPEISKAHFNAVDYNVFLKYESLPEIKFSTIIIDSKEGFSFYGLDQEKHLVSGRLPVENDEVILTREFTEKYLIENDTWITLFFNRPSGVVLQKDYKVVGTFELGIYKLSTSYVLLSMDALPEGFVINQYNIVMQVENPRNVEDVAKNIEQYFDLSVRKIRTWKDVYPDIVLLDNAQVIVIYMIQIFISFSIFIVVSSILGFSVHQKSKQLGILKAMGLKDNFVSQVFLLQSIILGFFGAIGGLIGGSIFLRLYQNFMVYEDGTPRIIITYQWYYYLISVGLIALTVLLASLISIRRAKKITIIELIKT